MSPELATDRLVSAALEAEVADELKRHGLVIWLDKDATWTPFVDALSLRHREGNFPHPIAAFRGSYLELLLAVENELSAVEQKPLLVHLPGLNEETVRATPALELYEAGRRFRRSLPTLIENVARGRVAPDEAADFARRAGITLADADAWLAQRLSAGREGLRGILEGMEPAWILEALFDGGSALRTRIGEEAGGTEVLAARLHQIAGMDEAWLDFANGAGAERSIDGLRDAFAQWLLCVEYTHDLRHLPETAALHRLKALQKPVVELCNQLTGQLRTAHGEYYVRIADALEERLADDREKIQPGDLGRIDTFRFEEAKVLEAAASGALEAARAATDPRRWDLPHSLVAARKDADSIGLTREEPRRWAWRLLSAAVDFGRAIAGAGRPLEKTQTLEEAVEIYRGAAGIDRAHREFEERCAALWHHHLPHLDLFHELRQALRTAHRAWADQLSRDFTRICTERGFLPDRALQQRHLFEQVVRPLVDGREKVALFLIDALRYEMALELAEEMGGPGTVVDLKGRLAELPTVTEVGMNVLAPVVLESGRLAAVVNDRGFGGFRTGEYTVRSPEDRTRAMRTRIGGQTCPHLPLENVAEGDTTLLRQQIGHANLVVVHAREIDQAGEAGFGPVTFTPTLRQIRAAFHHLQTAGVKRFVFTSDHGFLLQDAAAPARTFGQKKVPNRRYVLDPFPRREEGLVSVSLSELGYDGAEGHLLLAEDTTVFDKGGKDSFVHGGNSLQERVIPVLVVQRRAAQGSSGAVYTAEARQLPDVLGVKRLEVRVLSNDLFTRSIRFAMRAADRPQVVARIRQVGPNAREDRGVIEAPAGQAWTEIFFELEGPVDERVQLEIYDPDGREQIKPLRLSGYFEVSGRAAAAAPAPAPSSWQEQIPDEGARKVFLHLQSHGSLTEEEVVLMLGSPRAARRFDLRLDQWTDLLPFSVRTEGTSAGKRYVREG